MKNGGQFYLLTTIIIVTIIIGFASVVNFSKESNVNFDYTKDELQIESEKVLDYGLKNGANLTQLMINFTKEYADYSKQGELYFVFGNSNKIIFAGYQNPISNPVKVNISGNDESVSFQEGIYKYVEFSSPQKNAKIILNGIGYTFPINEGENFHFLILKEINDERHIITSQDEIAQVSVESESGPEILQLTITSNTTNYNIYNALNSPASPVNVTLTINSGVVVGSTSISSPALTTGNLPAGSEVTIINNGYILGKGGNGGNYPGGQTSGLPGGNGGPGLEITLAASISNNGIIAGGGGGGGGGGGSDCSECYDDPGAGGGGGAGYNSGTGGTSPETGTYTGSPGSLLLGGAGGTVSPHGGSAEYQQAGNGGNGGDLGTGGQNGQNGATYPGGTGGNGGAAVVGSNFITWTLQGDVRGTLQ